MFCYVIECKYNLKCNNNMNKLKCKNVSCIKCVLDCAPEQPRDKEEEPDKPVLIFLQYRGECSESYARYIRWVCTDSVVNSVPCKVISTLKKLVYDISVILTP